MVLLTGRRCARLCQALLVGAVLLAGQRNAAVLGDEDAMDSAKDVDGGGISENTPEACVDPTPMVEALEQEKAQLKNEFESCDAKRISLERLLQGLEATSARQEKVLDEFGGEKGIQKLAQAAAGAGDVTAAVKEAEESAEAAKKEAEAAKKEAAEAKKEAEEAKKEAAAAAKEAERVAAEKESLQNKLDAADEELKTLRSSLSKAEAKESKAREEHSRKTEDMRAKLERTASELEFAKKPRVVSMSAIYADLKHLVRELVEQSKEARDDIVQKASEKMQKASDKIDEARAIVQPHLEAAVEASKPVVKKAMDQTEPHRAKAAEVFREYRGKLDDKVGAPAAEKWSVAQTEVSKAWQQASSKCDEVGEAFVSKLVGAGVRKDDAQKTLKYLNIGFMCFFFGVLCWYLLGAVVTSIVWPLVRTVLRLALWLVKLPFRVLFLPIRLVLWVLTKCYRLAFGGGGKGGGKNKPPPTASKGANTNKGSVVKR